ncbi:MAG TPA: multifunctional CCA addition/repair protein [Gammaproteobacteria bacterium]
MKIYLVGGAVRDKLLQYPVKEKDWVVVGATPEQMADLGYKPVGKDFPVFLHPQTKEEYALARTERKTAPGYKGFAFNTDESVTLEEDLARRDLTINAIAEDEKGNIFDPYHGQTDLELKLLRHVSPAFAEDPVRILRVARFAARYKHLGFRVADETLELMKNMVQQGEVDALVAERVWQEMQKALGEQHPEEFIHVLKACGALQKILPEIDCLFGIPQPECYHPEIDTGVHTIMVLQQACQLSKNTVIRFAALVHDLGKGVTPKDILPSHRGHEERGVDVIKQLCNRLRIPNEYRDLAVLSSRFHLHLHRALELKTTTLLKTLEQLDALRKPQRFEAFLTVCLADIRGRKGSENCEYPQMDYMRQACDAIKNVEIDDLKQQELSGADMANAIRERRLKALKQIKKPG